MRVTIFPGSKRVKVNGLMKRLTDFDWAPFSDVHAVQAWLDRDRAEIEFKEVDPDGDGPLPSTKPANELISGGVFRERFGSILEAFQKAEVPQKTPVSQPAASAPGPSPLAEISDRLARLEQSFAILFEEVGKARRP